MSTFRYKFQLGKQIQLLKGSVNFSPESRAFCFDKANEQHIIISAALNSHSIFRIQTGDNHGNFWRIYI